MSRYNIENTITLRVRDRIIMKIGILHIHGMGSDKKDIHKKIISNIAKTLQNTNNIELEIEPVLYYEEMQKNQKDLLKRMGNIGLGTIRKWIINDLGDVATLGSDEGTSNRVNRIIDNSINKLKLKIGDNGKIVVIAQSLGCQVFSSYLNKRLKEGKTFPEIKLFFTTGCNIPIFISGMKKDDIKHFPPPSDGFKWINFWSKTDYLSYPLKSINIAYGEYVEDVRVRFWGLPFKVHTRYNQHKKVYRRISSEIKKLAL